MPSSPDSSHAAAHALPPVIIGATAGYGHVSPMLSIARDLAGRGHQVSFITAAMYRAAVEQAGARFVPVGGAAEIDPASFAHPDRLALAGLDQVNWDLQHFVIDCIADQHATLQSVLAEYGDGQAVVLTENGFFGVAPALLGAPGVRARSHIVIGVVPLSLSSIDAAPYGMGLPPDSSPAGRERNVGQNAFMQGTLFGSSQRLFAQTLRDLGATAEIPFMLDALAVRADRFLQLSVEELSYPRSDLPATLRFIGALPAAVPADACLPSWWPDVLEAEQVVVVTQGTVSNSDFSQLIAPTLEALADLPGIVIAATGSAQLPASIPANARVVQFVPFSALLPHADVLISNGGFGGTQQALGFGVPLVLAGDTEDKIEGNVRTAHTGAAINLKTQRPSPAALRQAVDEVLSKPAFRSHAQRLQAAYAALDPYAAIADAVATVHAA